MHDITAIVGENNAGKTAVLRALNSVMNFNPTSTLIGRYYFAYHVVAF